MFMYNIFVSVSKRNRIQQESKSRELNLLDSLPIICEEASPEPAKEVELVPEAAKKAKLVVEDSEESPPLSSKKKEEKRPPKKLRLDKMNHFPERDSARNATRCKRADCTQKSNWFCPKCGVHLCLTQKRNCFTAFHTIP